MYSDISAFAPSSSEEEWPAAVQRPGTGSTSSSVHLLEAHCDRLNLIHAFDDCEKPEHLEEAHTDMGRAWKLHTEKALPTQEQNPAPSCSKAIGYFKC